MSATAAAVASLDALDGRWKVEYTEVEGEMVPASDVGSAFLELQSGRFKVEKNGTVEYEGRYSVNDSVHPAEIVLIYEKSAKARIPWRAEAWHLPARRHHLQDMLWRRWPFLSEGAFDLSRIQVSVVGPC